MLLAAWFCANSPQSLTVNLVGWAKGARHFSHQQQLSMDVASLLCGKHRGAALAATPVLSRDAPAIPIPEGAMLKRIDLSFPQQIEGELRRSDRLLFDVAMTRVPRSERAEPALLPPRGFLES